MFDFHTRTKPHPVIFAAAFDPDGFKQASLDMVREAGVNLRLHSRFQSAIVEDGRAAGVIVETKEGSQVIRAEVVIDATGDLDVAAGAGAPFAEGAFIVTTVSRMGGVDTDGAERFRFEEPERFAELDRQAKSPIGGGWQYWWLKTPLPGVVWCNCPHMTGFDGLKAAGLTAAEFEGRRRMQALLEYARAHIPGFERAYFVDFAPQTGVRRTRLLEGVRVPDFTQVTMGPCCTQMLGDYGADVIKIERAGQGDLSRWSVGEDPDGGNNPVFASLNRNKRSVALDLKTDEDRAAVLRLVETSDVVVSNFRPGVMERMGFGYDDLRRLNPRIVYAVGTGFGLDGPYVRKGGRDVLAQAPRSAGFTAVNAEFFGDTVTGWGQPGGLGPDFRTGQDHPVVAGWRSDGG